MAKHRMSPQKYQALLREQALKGGAPVPPNHPGGKAPAAPAAPSAPAPPPPPSAPGVPKDALSRLETLPDSELMKRAATLGLDVTGDRKQLLKTLLDAGATG